MQFNDTTPATRLRPCLLFAAICILLTAAQTVWSDQTDKQSGVLASRVYKLRHITSDQAKDFLSQLNIGKGYNPLTPEVLIVTSNINSDLAKATGIIGMFDRPQPAQVQILATATKDQPLPEPEQFLAVMETETVTAGTMLEPPSLDAPNPVIFDHVGVDLVAIADADTMPKIIIAYENWKKKQTEASAAAKDAAAELPSDQVPVSTEPSKDKPVNTDAAHIEAAAKSDIAEPNQPSPDTAKEEIIASEQTSFPSLEQVAMEVLEGEAMAEPTQPKDETKSSVEKDDFMGNELLEALEREEQKAEISQPDSAPKQAAAVAEDPAPKTATPEPKTEDPFAALKKLLAKSGAEQQSPEPPAEPESPEIPEPPAEPESPEIPEPPVEPESPEIPESPVEQESPEKTPEQDPMKIMQALMAQSQARQQASEPAHAEETVPPKESKIQRQEEPDSFQSELQRLRQELAQLEAKAAEMKVPAETQKEESDTQDDKPLDVQSSPQIEKQLSEEELDTIVDLPQEVELESLVDLVGKQLGLNYMYDPVILKNQKVKLKIHGGKIKVRGMYSLLESVLRQKGFVMTYRDPFVVILKATDATIIAKQGELVLREPDDPIPPGSVIVRTKFDLDHISTASAKNLLTQFQMGLTNGFQEIAETNTLIVTDYAYRMDQIYKILKMIDVQGEKKEYEFRTLKYMKPSELVPKLQELAKQLEGVSLQISAKAAAPAASTQRTRTVRTRNPKTGQMETKQVPIPTPSKPSAAAKPSTPAAGPDTVYIDTDDRTNRILIAGKLDQIELVNELINALDVPQFDLKFVREYIIQNIEAEEVVNVMNELGFAAVSVSATKTTPTRTTTPARPGQPARPTTTAAKPATSSAAGSEQPHISIRPATNSLLINATAEQHQAIELVIAHVDVVQIDQRTIKQYEIQNVDAQVIIETLEDLLIIAPSSTTSSTRSTSRSSSSSRQSTGRTTQQQNAGADGAGMISLPTAAGGSEKEIIADQPQVSVLETTNSLLVYATPRQHDAIALVIGHADRQLENPPTPYVVYNLENQNAIDLASTLNELIQETFDQLEKKSTSDSKVQRAGTAALQSNIPAMQEERPKVIGDEKSNSIIVYGNKRNQQWISELVKELDQNRYQVLLDVTLVEISQDDVFNYDLDIISAVPDMTSLSGALDYGIGVQENPPSVSQILDNLANSPDDRKSFLEGTSRGGRFNGFYGNDHIMALLDIMQEKGYGRVLNRPRILVNDNEPGVITLEEVTYRRVAESVIQGSDTLVTTENVRYDDYSAGITLEITPHISQEDRLRLEIKLNRSTFLPTTTTDESQPPDTINSDVDSVVTVPDESTVILGGLDRITLVKGGTKVPILGDIPIIGGLFRTITNENDQRKIYIFVKANILRPGEDNQDLKDISEKNIAVFEHYEREMQNYQDWPGIDSAPMKPERLLREEEDILEKLNQQEPAI